MKNQISGNYLRTHRRRAGLTQRELGVLLGYKDSGQVSRHERSKTAPPLMTALAYETIFHVPVSALFVGVHTSVARMIDTNVNEFETSLRIQDGKGPAAKAIAQKLEWLVTRKAK
jgi:DNA-binding XRE family transcriptional regulator